MNELNELRDRYPNKNLWLYRERWFSWAMGEALGDGEFIGMSSSHARILEIELETVFCAGAWLATIVLACAAAEVYVASQGKKREAKFLTSYGLRDEWIWLLNRRNTIVHSTPSSPQNIAEVERENPDLEEDAKRAVLSGLKILLLGTRIQLESSIKRSI